PPADVAEIRPGDVLDFRQRVAREPHERLIAIRGLERVGHALGRRPWRERDVDGLENAAIEWDEVRHERDVRAELLLHLRHMAMFEDAIRGYRSVVFGEVRAFGRLRARARDARLRVDDDARGAIEETGLRERQEREERGGRVAARACDEL